MVDDAPDTGIDPGPSSPEAEAGTEPAPGREEIPPWGLLLALAILVLLLILLVLRT